MIRKIIFCSIILLIVSCTKQPKIITKTLNYNDTSIRWYHYSYIEGSSPDIIEINNSDQNFIIYKSSYGIYDLTLDGNKLRIYTYPGTSKSLKFNKLFGLKISLDTLGQNFKGWDKVPKGKVEFRTD